MAGVGLAFVGFVIIVMGFRGTWSKVWHDLFGGGGVDANTLNLSSLPGWTGSTPHVDPGSPSPAPFPAGPGIGNSPFWLYPNNPSTPYPGSTPPPKPSQQTNTIGLRLPNTFIQTPSRVLT